LALPGSPGAGHRGRETFHLYRTAGLGEDGVTLDHLKSVVDEAFVNGGWVVFKQHCKYPSWTADAQNDLRLLIQYIKSKGIRIVNIRDGLKLNANLVDIGNLTNYTRIGKDTFESSELEKRNYLTLSVLGEGSSYSLESPITDFPHGVTSLYYRNIDTSTQPVPESGVGGVWETHRPAPISGNGDYGAFQLFFPLYSNKIYKRLWVIGTTSWGDWGEYTPVRKYKNILVDFGTINGNSLKEVTLTVSGIVASNIIIANPVGGIDYDLLYVVSSPSNNTVRIKVYNTSATAKTAYTRNFNITEIT
jgi:hypothetical protein